MKDLLIGSSLCLVALGSLPLMLLSPAAGAITLICAAAGVAIKNC